MNWSAITRSFAAVAAALIAGTVTGGGTAVGAPASEAGPAGTLELRASLRLVSTLGSACPPGTAPATDCPTRTADGLVSGLGRVTEAYTYPIAVGLPVCADGLAKALGYSVRLLVADKGELQAAVADAQCVDRLAAGLAQAQSFTITGGTGAYVAASGGGTIERRLGQTQSGAAGIETWTGTLTVPGLEFDVTPPTLAGAGARTARAARGAKRARVRFAVTARDDVDGAVLVSCRPRSGSWFRIGRTTVSCSATDTSGNTRAARFRVVVRSA